MSDLASSGIYANDTPERGTPVPPAPPVAPHPLGLVVWGTVCVAAGALLGVVGPFVVLVLAPELAWLLGVHGWVDGLLRTTAVALVVLAGVAMITLGRGVRALAWIAHRSLEQDAAAAVDPATVGRRAVDS